MNGSDRQTGWGVGYSLLASTLFGVIFFVSGVIDASPEHVFGWRMAMTTACYVLMLCTAAGRRALESAWSAATATLWTPLVVLAASFLVGLQMWLFAWAPVHGHALDASLGYLLLPIALVLIGRVTFRDHVSGLQWVAVGIAAFAVLVNILATAAISWVSFTVCLGYAAYFSLRRRFGLEGAAAFGIEVALTLPVAVTFIVSADGATTGGGQSAVLIAGLAGAVAMSAYVVASGTLSMPVFGLLSYAEPVLLFVVALLLGERLTSTDAVVYALLAVALLVLAYAGFASGRTQRRRRGTVEETEGIQPPVPV